MSTLSIDLAYTRHSDIGVALLHHDQAGVLHAAAVPVPLTGPPTVNRRADWIEQVANANHVRGLCIDGPSGWQGPETPAHYGAQHSRWSEKLLRAPGKTGLPGIAKPSPYLPFTAFSIALFERLTQSGWTLPDGSHRSARDATAPERLVTESFPTAAWRALGLAPLPGKARVGRNDAVLEAARASLRRTLGLALTNVVTHDELQAVVGGVAGAWWASGVPERVRFAGAPPFRLDGSWREGYIIVPATLPPLV